MRHFFDFPHSRIEARGISQQLFKASQASAFALGLLLLCPAMAEAITFRTPSIGYHPQGPKIAVIEDIPEGQHLKLVLFSPTRRSSRPPFLVGATVYKIDNTRAFTGSRAQGPGTTSLVIDFSDFKTPGEYELRVEDTDIKVPVKISEFLYWDTMKPLIKSFYYQRSGQTIEDPTLKVFHAASHVYDANFLTNRPTLKLDEDEQDKDVVGGWYNGGDYAKYVTSVAMSAARLMSMYEWNPKPFQYFKLDYIISEPNLGDSPDLQHETRYGLDWLMTMQRSDGAFYRKVAGKQWPGNVAPEDDEMPRFIFGISTQETANAVAALAMVPRAYKKVDLGYGVKALLSAEKGWNFLASHPTPIFESSDSDFTGSGEFISYTPDRKLIDAPSRIWAAAELYITTSKPQYHNYFLANYRKVPFEAFSWVNPAFQGMIDYVLFAPNPDEEAVSYIKQQLLSQADTIRDAVLGDEYGAGISQFGRASNQKITERIALLLTAYRVSGDTKYRDAAAVSVDYFFGVNPLGETYVTGIGDHAVAHPAHRWMQAMEKTIPGYLVNGPDEKASETTLVPQNMGAASYIDNAKAVSVNEPTLLNNAGLAYVLALLNAAYNSGEKECKPGALPGTCL